MSAGRCRFGAFAEFHRIRRRSAADENGERLTRRSTPPLPGELGVTLAPLTVMELVRVTNLPVALDARLDDLTVGELERVGKTSNQCTVSCCQAIEACC
jgi:hypothetical protein